jgi:hypothetical protein
MIALALSAVLPIWLAAPAFGSDVRETAHFPERIRIASKELKLNGVGTRTATLFAVKVYRAAFYADRSIASLPDALGAPNPKALEIRYLRDFTLRETRDAWRFQFRESAGLKEGELRDPIEAFIEMQRPIAENDVQRLDFLDGRTIFSIDGKPRGEIPGADFQRAVLTVFFGPNPPTEDLKKGLTRGIRETTEEAR